MINTKFCPKCKTVKDSQEFYRHSKRSDGLAAWCKDCNSYRGKKNTAELRSKVLDRFGNKCARCGFSDSRALQIDNVNGGGVQEHNRIPNTIAYLNKVLFDSSHTYQILCANCNWIKRHELGEVSGGQFRPKKEGPRQEPHKHTDETKQLISDKVKNAWANPELREKFIAAAKASAHTKVSDADLLLEYSKTLSPQTTARIVGLAYSATHRRLVALGVLVSRADRQKAQAWEIKELHDSGMTAIDIGKKLNIHRGTVARRLKGLKENACIPLMI